MELSGAVQFAHDSSLRAWQSGDANKITKSATTCHRLLESSLAQGPTHAVACQKGCSHCCYRPVEALPAEVLLIEKHLSSWDMERLEAFKARLGAHIQNEAQYWHDEEQARPIQPCPLLENGECSVYEVRPTSCRGLFSSSALACKEHYIESGLAATLAEPAQASRQLWFGAARGQIAAGEPSGQCDLAAALNNRFAEDKRPWSSFIQKSPIVPTDIVAAPVYSRLLAEPSLGAALDARQGGSWEQFVALRSRVQSPIARNLLSLMVPRIHRDEGQIQESSKSIENGLVRLEDEPMGAAELWHLGLLPVAYEWAYLGVNVRPWMEKYSAILSSALRTLAPELLEGACEKRNPGKPRIGVVSYRLNYFNGSRWALGWLKHFQPEFEVYAFHCGTNEDHQSAKWRRLVDHYYHLPFPAIEVGRKLKELDLDVVLFTDIGMDGFTTCLSQMRLARLQMNAWGHPVTSGSPNMDWYLSGDWMEPDSAQDHYSEKLVRLPGTGLTYPSVPEARTNKTAADFGLPEKFLLNAQNPMKLLPRHDQMYADIADQAGVPVVFVSPPQSHDAAALRNRLGAYRGLVVVDHQTMEDFRQLTRLCQAVLDSPDWNGGNTTIEALCYGRPVITLPGEFMRSRHGIAFLRQANLGALVATNESHFKSLASDQGSQLSAMLESDPMALLNDPRPAVALKTLVLNSVN